MSIEAAHYQQTRDALANDPVIQQMGQEIVQALDAGTLVITQLRHAGTGQPHYEFMSGSLWEYRRRGGEINSHIGGPAEAILALVDPA